MEMKNEQFWTVLILTVVFLLVFIRVFLSNRQRKDEIEHFNEIVNLELQQRAGPLTTYDIERRQLIQAEFPTLPTYFLPFKRFHIEIFRDVNFKNRIAELKDSTEQLLAISTNSPIRSIRIRSVPNDNWRFLQFFSVGVYAPRLLDTKDNKGIVYHVPHRNGKSIDYKVDDTKKEFPWMNTYAKKIVYFVTNIYDPLLDLESAAVPLVNKL